VWVWTCLKDVCYNYMDMDSVLYEIWRLCSNVEDHLSSGRKVQVWAVVAAFDQTASVNRQQIHSYKQTASVNRQHIHSYKQRLVLTVNTYTRTNKRLVLTVSTYTRTNKRLVLTVSKYTRTNKRQVLTVSTYTRTKQYVSALIQHHLWKLIRTYVLISFDDNIDTCRTVIYVVIMCTKQE